VSAGMTKIEGGGPRDDDAILDFGKPVTSVPGWECWRSLGPDFDTYASRAADDTLELESLPSPANGSSGRTTVFGRRLDPPLKLWACDSVSGLDGGR
jgi:hypothetical protein